MKTILITGSTDGIGKLTALQLASKGHSVLLHGRNKAKLDSAIEEIISRTANTHVTGYLADFSDLSDVRKMAAELSTDISSLDIIINNAGIYNSPVAQTETGHDIRFLVNYLAPIVLTNALLPLLKKSNDPRIINLSSAAQSPVNLTTLSGGKQLSAGEAYAQSKLAFTMWSMELADAEKDITVIPVNPGSLLNTKMVREAFGRHWSAPEKGSDILEWLATDASVKERSGTYYDNDSGSFSKAHPDAYSAEKIRHLHEATIPLISD